MSILCKSKKKCKNKSKNKNKTVKIYRYNKKKVIGGGPVFSMLGSNNINSENNINSKNNNENHSLGNIGLKSFIQLFWHKMNSVNMETQTIIKQILTKIYHENRIKSFLKGGGTKNVFLVKDNTKVVFKVIILKRELLGMFIKEPLYMLTSKYCNTPSDINVYCNNKSRCSISGIKIINNSELDNYCIITWYEENAIATGSLTSLINDKQMDEYNKFKAETIPILTRDRFRDLGIQNIGFFKNEPYFRWIDLLPEYEPIDNCLYLNIKP